MKLGCTNALEDFTGKVNINLGYLLFSDLLHKKVLKSHLFNKNSLYSLKKLRQNKIYYVRYYISILHIYYKYII